MYEKRNPPKVGPGTYKPKQFIGKEGVRSSLHPKLKDFNLVHSRNSPGPGRYDVTESAKKIMKGLPSYGIGSSERPESI